MKFKLPAVAFLALATCACGGTEQPSDAPPPPAPKKEGRPETQAIRNTQAVGVNGKAIADKVDDALKKSEQRAKDTEQKSEEQ